MSTPQRNDACVISVDSPLGEILRHQTLVVLEANHHHFEDLLDLNPQAQHAVSVIYRDAFAVLDALGWTPGPNAEPINVPLTAGYLLQLRRRHQDLIHTNLDRLAMRNQSTDDETIAALDTQIAADHMAARALVRLLVVYEA
ncbi:MAG TPA: hypothetical protein VGM94_06390 [Galbitalea sp.]|jgi:hypothetical protein